MEEKRKSRNRLMLIWQLYVDINGTADQRAFFFKINDGAIVGTHMEKIKLGVYLTLYTKFRD